LAPAAFAEEALHDAKRPDTTRLQHAFPLIRPADEDAVDSAGR
jgi:hypothetical protein